MKRGVRSLKIAAFVLVVLVLASVVGAQEFWLTPSVECLVDPDKAPSTLDERKEKRIFKGIQEAIDAKKNNEFLCDIISIIPNPKTGFKLVSGKTEGSMSLLKGETAIFPYTVQAKHTLGTLSIEGMAQAGDMKLEPPLTSDIEIVDPKNETKKKDCHPNTTKIEFCREVRVSVNPGEQFEVRVSIKNMTEETLKVSFHDILPEGSYYPESLTLLGGRGNKSLTLQVVGEQDKDVVELRSAPERQAIRIIGSDTKLVIKKFKITHTRSDPRNIGVFIERSKNVELIENTIFENDGEGVSLTKSQEVLIKGNTIKENKKEGILLRNSSSAKMENNAVIRNGGCGVNVDADSTVGGEGNRIAGNKTGNLCGTPKGGWPPNFRSPEIWVPEDFTEIQEAIWAACGPDNPSCPTDKEKGDTISVAPKKDGKPYKNLIIPFDPQHLTKLTLKERGTVILQGDELNPQDPVIHIQSSVSFKLTIEGFQIKGAKFAPGLLITAVASASSTPSIIEMETIIKGTVIQDNNTGIEINDLSFQTNQANQTKTTPPTIVKLSIENSKILNNSGGGVIVPASRVSIVQLTVTSSEVSGNKNGPGLKVEAGLCVSDPNNPKLAICPQVTVSSSSIYNNKGGVVLENPPTALKTTIEGSEIFSNDENGILAKGTAEFEVISSQIHDNKKSGIQLKNPIKATLENSEIYDNVEKGIAISSDIQSDIKITCSTDKDKQCIFSTAPEGKAAKQSVGISVEGLPKVAVTDAKIARNGTGISIACLDNILCPLVFVEGTALTPPESSLISDNDLHGIHVKSGKVVVGRVKISNNGRDGILVERGAKQVSITKSTISNNGTASQKKPDKDRNGVHIEVGEVDVAIVKNLIEANGGDGILLEYLPQTAIIKDSIKINGNEIFRNMMWGVAAWIKNCYESEDAKDETFPFEVVASSPTNGVPDKNDNRNLKGGVCPFELDIKLRRPMA